MEGDNEALWRDQIGFLVTDKQQLCELTVDVRDFLSTLHPHESMFWIFVLMNDMFYH